MTEENGFTPPDEEKRNGCRNTFRRLYSTYYKALVSYAFSLLDSLDEAEDVVQEAFVSVWERTNSDTMAVLHARRYLYLLVRNKCVDMLRHRKIVDTYAQNAVKASASQQTVESELFTEDVYKQLFQMIDQLPQKQREVFLLYMDGKSNKEIAEALNVTIETVKTQKRRGKEYLKKNLTPTAKLLLIALLFE